MPGDVQKLPEEERHGRAAAHRLRRWRGGQERQEEEQGPHVCTAGGEIPPLWNQDGVADDPPHPQPQVSTHRQVRASYRTVIVKRPFKTYKTLAAFTFTRLIQ